MSDENLLVAALVLAALVALMSGVRPRATRRPRTVPSIAHMPTRWPAMARTLPIFTRSCPPAFAVRTHDR